MFHTHFRNFHSIFVFFFCVIVAKLNLTQLSDLEFSQILLICSVGKVFDFRANICHYSSFVLSLIKLDFRIFFNNFSLSNLLANNLNLSLFVIFDLLIQISSNFNENHVFYRIIFFHKKLFQINVVIFSSF